MDDCEVYRAAADSLRHLYEVEKIKVEMLTRVAETVWTALQEWFYLLGGPVGLGALVTGFFGKHYLVKRKEKKNNA